MKVTQSSRWAATWTGTRLIDGKGIDGRWSSQGCAATSDAYRPHNLVDGMEFFSLELEAPQKIAKVQIANRVDCCFYRGNNIRITVGPSPVYDPEEPLCLPEITQLSKSAGLQDYVCDGDVQGKFVKISRPGHINLCEVKVFTEEGK